MELTVVVLSKLLSVSPDTIERWTRQGKLPVSKKKNIFKIKTIELKKWAANNHIRLDLKDDTAQKPKKNNVTLSGAIQNGGVYFDVQGQDIMSVLSSAVEKLQAIPKERKGQLLDQLIERESALSTGIGKGFAIPHPRQPQTYLENPMVSVCFLSEPVDYKALDNQSVSVLFIILCPVLKMHLQLLSAISFCLKDTAFVEFLSTKPDAPSLLEKIDALSKSNPI